MVLWPGIVTISAQTARLITNCSKQLSTVLVPWQGLKLHQLRLYLHPPCAQGRGTKCCQCGGQGSRRTEAEGCRDHETEDEAPMMPRPRPTTLHVMCPTGSTSSPTSTPLWGGTWPWPSTRLAPSCSASCPSPITSACTMAIRTWSMVCHSAHCPCPMANGLWQHCYAHSVGMRPVAVGLRVWKLDSWKGMCS